MFIFGVGCRYKLYIQNLDVESMQTIDMEVENVVINRVLSHCKTKKLKFKKPHI